MWGATGILSRIRGTGNCHCLDPNPHTQTHKLIVRTEGGQGADTSSRLTRGNLPAHACAQRHLPEIQQSHQGGTCTPLTPPPAPLPSLATPLSTAQPRAHPRHPQTTPLGIHSREDSLQHMVGKLDSCMQKNQTESLSYTIHKDKLKTDSPILVGRKRKRNIKSEIIKYIHWL